MATPRRDEAINYTNIQHTVKAIDHPTHPKDCDSNPNRVEISKKFLRPFSTSGEGKGINTVGLILNPLWLFSAYAIKPHNPALQRTKTKRNPTRENALERTKKQEFLRCKIQKAAPFYLRIGSWQNKFFYCRFLLRRKAPDY